MSTLEHNDFYSTTPKKIMENVKHMSCNVYQHYYRIAVIKEDGSLWMWGHNDNGE